MSKDRRDVRRDYEHGELRRAHLAADPVEQFARWLDAAVHAELIDATAMTLATADAAGYPSARIVLLKHYGADGFVWYTGYGSQKGLELAVNPQASLLFYWREFERQVRISGRVAKIDPAESQTYFDSRPLDSRVAAAISDQSKPIDDRSQLQAKYDELLAKAQNGAVAMPQDWGGYRLVPELFEFWQGRVGRLHDRFRYSKDGADWRIERLQP